MSINTPNTPSNWQYQLGRLVSAASRVAWYSAVATWRFILVGLAGGFDYQGKAADTNEPAEPENVK